jgi:hypothetical protein
MDVWVFLVVVSTAWVHGARLSFWSEQWNQPDSEILGTTNIGIRGIWLIVDRYKCIAYSVRAFWPSSTLF